MVYLFALPQTTFIRNRYLTSLLQIQCMHDHREGEIHKPTSHTSFVLNVQNALHCIYSRKTTGQCHHCKGFAKLLPSPQTTNYSQLSKSQSTYHCFFKASFYHKKKYFVISMHIILNTAAKYLETWILKAKDSVN